MSQNYIPLYTPNVPVSNLGELYSQANLDALQAQYAPPINNIPSQYSAPVNPNLPTASQDTPPAVGIPITKRFTRPIASGNLGENVLRNLEGYGTGLQYIWYHPLEIAGEGVNYLNTRFNQPIPENTPLGKTLGAVSPSLTPIGDLITAESDVSKQLAEDAINLGLINYDVNVQDFRDIAEGIQTPSQVAGRAVYNAWANPVDTALDISSLGIGKVITTPLRGLLKGAARNLKKAADVEKALNVTTSSTSSKLQEVAQKAERLADNVNEKDLEAAIESAQQGTKVEDTTIKAAKEYLKDLAQTYDKQIPQVARVNNFELAHNQRMVDAGKATSILEADKALDRFRKAGISEELSLSEGLKQLESGVKPASELDMDAVRAAAKEGDDVAQEILKSKEAFDSGDLFLVPHGLADVTKTSIGRMLAEGKGRARKFWGKYSERVYGGASYRDIAQQLRSPELWLDSQARAFTEAAIGQELLKQVLNGKELVDSGTKVTKYISREKLANGKLMDALNTASDIAVKADDIPIDRVIVKELRNQLRTAHGALPFGSALANDIYQIAKRNMLATGLYLAGNFNTGVVNAIMNAGLNPIGLIQDFLEAVFTKGKLTKNLGIHRLNKRGRYNYSNGVTEFIGRVNEVPSNYLNSIDAAVQNTLAEMASNRKLRDMGIPLARRAEAISSMGKEKLADVIKDAKSIALLNPSRTVLPHAFHGIAGILNPFWRWMDTAAQATFYMLDKHPVVSNVVYNKLAHGLAYDTEMQNRMNMKVTSDKPFVTYKFNPRTGKIQEMSSEFITGTNTMKLAANTARAIQKGDLKDIPVKLDPANTVFFGALAGALAGVDRYGRPIVRPEMDRNLAAILNNERYRYNGNTHKWERIGFQGDEVLATTINELIAYPKLLNRTIAPIGVGLFNLATGSDLRYYQPYQNQLIGEIAPAGQMPSYANPRRSMAGTEMLQALAGTYSTDYNPELERYLENPIDSLADRKRIMRSRARRYGRTQEILNRYR